MLCSRLGAAGLGISFRNRMEGSMRKVLGLVGATMLFAGPALAADLAVKAPPVVPLAVPTWTGWYIGLNAGGHWGGDCVDTVTRNIFSIGGLNGNIGGGRGLLEPEGAFAPDERAA